MLKGIDPVLTPELLKLLCEMGHGDEIVLADANFTAEALAGEGSGRPVLRLSGVGMQATCQAVLSVFPLDSDVLQPVGYMQVGNQPPGYCSELQRGVLARMEQDGVAGPAQCEPLERFAFYDRARRAYAIVQTGELQPYANFVFKKGVIADGLRP
ncbi:MAG: RbsD or FucU transport [Methylibium sp. NZG]|nr:MAG: RbsD or FucU transport [Methylibium sp. NZG]